jgi:hypothetical protein
MFRWEGIRLSVSNIFKQTTIANMANVVSEGGRLPIEKSYDVHEILPNSMKDIDREDVVQKAGVELTNLRDTPPVTAGQLYCLSAGRHLAVHCW